MSRDRCATKRMVTGADKSGDSGLTSKLLLSVCETGQLLGISRRTVFLLLARGELKRRKLLRRTMIHRDDVIRFAAQCGSGGDTPSGGRRREE
jgi:Helix-turn-helix domain